MPTYSTSPAHFDTSAFLFPAEWQAVSEMFGESGTALLLLRDGVIVHVNEALERLLGFSKTELIGKPLLSFMSSGVYAGGQNSQFPPQGTTLHIARKDGMPIELHLRIKHIDELFEADETAWIAIAQTTSASGECNMPPLTAKHAFDIIDSLPEPVLACGPDTRLRYANPAAARLLGCKPALLSALRLIDLVHQDDKKQFITALDNLRMENAAPQALAFRLKVNENPASWRHVSGQARAFSPLHDVPGALLNLRDVTEQQLQLQSMATEKKRQLHYLNRLLRLAQRPHANFASSLKVIVKASAKALGAHRCSYWEIAEDPLATRCVMAYDDSLQNILAEEPGSALAIALHPLLRKVASGKQALVAADVDQHPCAVSACEYFHASSIKAAIIVPVLHEEKTAGLLLVSQRLQARAWSKDEAEFMCNSAELVSLIFREIKRSRVETQIRHMAHRDSLTGLPDRHFLFEQASDIFPRVAVGSATLAVFFINLDDFKSLNDGLGHATGDELLKAVASRLKNVVREDDILVRLGGDEFMLMARNLADTQVADDIAQQIIDALNGAFSLLGRPLQISASVGVALYPLDGTDIDTLMKKASIAMHHAKSGGRNQYRMFEPRLSTGIGTRSILEAELRQAISKGELQHYYQPQVDLRTDKVRCVEALLRWQHPRHGMLLPVNFLPIAEQTDLIHDISAWALNDACDQLAIWRRQGLERFSIALNLSHRQLMNNQLLPVLGEALERTSVIGSQLEWEIEESTAMQHSTMTTSILDELTKMQIGLSIDRFGAGCSSLVSLRRYPLRKLKIAPGFVNGLPTEVDGRAITDAIISMARPLGLDVVAEGVETPEQMRYLRAHGCDIAQGYYFARPLTAEQFGKWLMQH